MKPLRKVENVIPVEDAPIISGCACRNLLNSHINIGWGFRHKAEMTKALHFHTSSEFGKEEKVV